MRQIYYIELISKNSTNFSIEREREGAITLKSRWVCTNFHLLKLSLSGRFFRERWLRLESYIFEMDWARDLILYKRNCHYRGFQNHARLGHGLLCTPWRLLSGGLIRRSIANKRLLNIGDTQQTAAVIWLTRFAKLPFHHGQYTRLFLSVYMSLFLSLFSFFLVL